MVIPKAAAKSRADKQDDRKKATGRVRNTLGTLGALSLSTFDVGTGRAATAFVNPRGDARADPITAAQVYNTLNADQSDYFRHVNVDVGHGVVTLSGYVWSTPAIYRAQRLAAALPSVTRVIDQMELEHDGLGSP